MGAVEIAEQLAQLHLQWHQDQKQTKTQKKKNIHNKYKSTKHLANNITCKQPNKNNI